MNAVGVIALSNPPLSQERLLEEGLLDLVLDRLFEALYNVPVNSKGIFAVSAMTREYRPALEKMDKDKLDTLIYILISDTTNDPAWHQVRGEVAFFLACAMEEEARRPERESIQIQKTSLSLV